MNFCYVMYYIFLHTDLWIRRKNTKKRIADSHTITYLIAFFPEKYTVKDHISNTKLEKGDRYYIQTRHKDLVL